MPTVVASIFIALACPVYVRESEGSPKGLCLGVVRTAMFITTDADYGNPSSRRDGVAIELICEECHQSTEISFAQHKGETHVTGQLLYDQLPDYAPVVTRLFDDAEKVAAAEPFTSRRRTREGHAESIQAGTRGPYPRARGSANKAA